MMIECKNKCCLGVVYYCLVIKTLSGSALPVNQTSFLEPFMQKISSECRVCYLNENTITAIPAVTRTIKH